MSMSLIIFQVIWWTFRCISWVVNRNGNAPLIAGVCFRGIDVVIFKVFGVDNTVAIGVGFVLGKASASKYRESNSKGFEVM